MQVTRTALRHFPFVNRPLSALALGVLLGGCAQHAADEAAPRVPGAPASASTAASSDLVAASPLNGETRAIGETGEAAEAKTWTSGKLQTDIVPYAGLKAMPDVLLGGSPMVKSNNPEKFSTTGWLVQHARRDARRGGNPHQMNGQFDVYISHINGTSVQRFVQIIAVNPGSQPVTITSVGSVVVSTDSRTSGTFTGRSNYYVQSEDFLNSNFNVSLTRTIPAGGATQLSVSGMARGASIDGLLQTQTNGGVHIYVVVTEGNTLAEARNLAAGAGSRAAEGNIKPPTSSAFGTEAGVYANSIVRCNPLIPLPAGIAHTALSLNEAGYLETPSSPRIQTAPAAKNSANQTLRLSDSGLRTNGNYGHEYDHTWRLQNPTNRARRVRIWFASNNREADGDLFARGLLYNGAMSFRGSGPIRVFTTPAAPKVELTSAANPVVVGANQTVTVPLRYWIPGLGSASSQLIFETQD